MEYLDQMYFYVTGDFVEFSCKAKSPPGRIALRRRGNYVAEATRRRRILSSTQHIKNRIPAAE